MKCIKNVATNKIERVSNETAHTRVNSGKWNYIPKHEYKSQQETQQQAIQPNKDIVIE